MMRVVVKKPGASSAVEMVEPGLANHQAIVGGYLRAAIVGHGFFDGQDRLVVMCDDDGIQKELAFNLRRPSDGHSLFGTLLAIKVDDEGDDVSMTEDDAKRVCQLLDELAARSPN